VTGNIAGNAASITGTVLGTQVSGNIAGNAASITGSITESQVSNLTFDLTGLSTSIATKVPLAFIGAANGVASLDGSSLVPTSQLPSLSGLYVDLTTNQSVAGNKTFTGLFTTGNATINQATNGSNALFGKYKQFLNSNARSIQIVARFTF